MTATNIDRGHDTTCSVCQVDYRCDFPQDFCVKRGKEHMCFECREKAIVERDRKRKEEAAAQAERDRESQKIREEQRIERERIEKEEEAKLLAAAIESAREYYTRSMSWQSGHWLNDRVFPKRFESKTIETFDVGVNAKDVELAKTTIDAGGSIFISGECGRGKTHLAVGLARVWFLKNLTGEYDKYAKRLKIEIDRFPCFLPAVEFFLELKHSFDSKSGDSESSIIKSYAGKELLIIDDLGAEKVSDWSRQVFYTLLDRRYRDMKQTIITSNLSLSDLAQQIDVRISSRILEMGVAIQLKGTDMRAKK